MIHKISELCNRGFALNKLFLQLYKMKYIDKASKKDIDNLIAQIQFMCYTIYNDKQEYKKWKNTE